MYLTEQTAPTVSSSNTHTG